MRSQFRTLHRSGFAVGRTGSFLGAVFQDGVGAALLWPPAALSLSQESKLSLCLKLPSRKQLVGLAGLPLPSSPSVARGNRLLLSAINGANCLLIKTRNWQPGVCRAAEERSGGSKGGGSWQEGSCHRGSQSPLGKTLLTWFQAARGISDTYKFHGDPRCLGSSSPGLCFTTWNFFSLPDALHPSCWYCRLHLARIVNKPERSLLGFLPPKSKLSY